VLQQIEQLAAAGAVNGSLYGLLGAGFGLILGVTGRFHYAFGLVFTVAAYVASTLEHPAGWPVVPAVAAGLCAAMAAGVAIERWIYRPLAAAAGSLSLLTVFISSLGVAIAGVNLITLAFTAFSRSIEILPVEPIAVGGATITTLEFVTILACWILVLALNLVLDRTDLGRTIKAVRGNPLLAEILGLDAGRIYLIVFAVGSLFAGAAGILHGARFAVLPDMGVRPVVFAFVVAFLGGTRRPPYVTALAGLFIGLVESLSGLWVSPQWSSLVVFSVLFVYLVVHPMELRGFRRALLVGATRRA
jgi:branched-chain amino acid transport system permease protein